MTLQEAYEALEKKGFRPKMFDSAEAAAEALLSEIPQGATVGVGGSVTIEQLGVEEPLRARGNAVYWHWRVPSSERYIETGKAHVADYYLMSANAIGRDGTLYNIDGTGNRIGAMLCGTGKLIVVAGRNKLTDEEDPFQRVKREACPPNARRLALDTPCSKLSRCTDCSSKHRMCKISCKLEYPPNGRDMQIWLVDADLGY